MTIGADNITLDLGGHALASVHGINIASTGHNRVTIKNGSVGGNSSGIVLTNGHYNAVRNITGREDGSVVALIGGSHNAIIHGRFEGTLVGPDVSLIGEHRDVIKANVAFGISDVAIGLNHTDRSVVIGNHVENQTIAISGNRNLLRFDRVYHARSDGFDVTGNRNVLADNVAFASGTSGSPSADGIKVATAGNLLTRNIADNNAGYGIEAVVGVIDGGDNFAAENGQAAQCLNVLCEG